MKFFKTNLPLKAFSLLIAIALWVYVAQALSPDIEKTVNGVPVVFTNTEALEEKGLFLLKDKEHTVNLKLSGKRKALVDVNASNVTALCDVKDITEIGNHAAYTNVILPVGGVEILEKSPASLQVEVDYYQTATKEIQIEAGGLPKSGFVVGDMRVTPNAVEISGPKSVVDGVDSAKARVDLQDRDADAVSVSAITLYGANGREINSTYVKLGAKTAEVHCEIQKTQSVKVAPRLARDFSGDMIFEIDAASVKDAALAGAADALEGLSYIKTKPLEPVQMAEGDFEAALDLPAKVRQIDAAPYTFRLVSAPRAEKTVPAGDVKLVQLAEGLSAALRSAESLEAVRLVGSRAALDKITNAAAALNLSGLGPGSFTVQADILADGVWVLGEYPVEVEITQK
jgi:YbbR domain-containing protein